MKRDQMHNLPVEPMERCSVCGTEYNPMGRDISGGFHPGRKCAIKAAEAATARLSNAAPDLLAALKAAAERMEAVAEGIPVQNRANGVSQATHVAHMAGHLAQHAKIVRAAIAKATGE